MTLDEAIEMYTSNAEYERTHGSLQGCMDFRQLAEWLKDYKRLLAQEPKTGHWIEDAKTYYEELNKRGLGVDEYTPYFTDDIACSECLAKYSMLDNETQFFKHCPNCGAKMIEESEG